MPGIKKPESYFIDKYVGVRFGRLIIIDIWPPGDIKRDKYPCLCECGKIKYISIDSLRMGLTKSCGCIKSETTKQKNTTHNMSHLKEYKAWCYAKARCAAKSGKLFKNYGSRGIKVCDSWANSFEVFYKHMGPKPSNKHTLDRINNDKGYEPGNCRWVINKVQSANRSDNIFIEYNGELLIMSECARRNSMPVKTLSQRYAKGIRGKELFFKGRLRLNK